MSKIAMQTWRIPLRFSCITGPPSAYNLFIKASIPGLKGQASPGKSLFSQAASAWAALPPEKKKAFETESQALKSIADAKKDHGKAKEDKKPLSHYTLFVQQRYPAVAAKNPTLKPKEIMALVAGEWKAVPEAEKKDRKSAADALKQAYLSKHPS